MMKKIYFLYIAIIIAFVVSNVIAIPVLISKGMFTNASGSFTMINYIRWEITLFTLIMVFLCVVMSHKFASGKFQEVLFVIASILIISIILGYLVFALIQCGFDFTIIDWFGSFDVMMFNFIYYLILLLIFALLFAVYCVIINKDFISIFNALAIL